MKTILIAGGAGFIGSNLIKKLYSDGNNNIICLDNLYTGSIDNLGEFMSKPRFKFIKHDIIEPLEINEKIDEIYNLASAASPVHYQGNHAVLTTLSNVVGSNNLLNLAKVNNSKILFTSTSEVYGDPLKHPQKEEHWGNVNPIGVRSCYDEAKRCAESLFFSYHRIYGIRIKIVRIFNTYGVNMNPSDGRVVSNLIIQALKNQDLTVYGDGSQTRSFCYVDDMTGALIKAMNTKDDFLGPVNLGNPDEISINELAQIIRSKINPKLNIIYKNIPKDDPSRRKPDISLAKKMLDWAPKISLKDGLDKTINYYRNLNL